MQPTKETYEAFQTAYGMFNRRLFDDRLPECLITMQRRGGTYGYYCQSRFVNGDGQRTDEIALNPTYFSARSEAGVFSTLVHEMVHLRQHHFGQPGRRGYHNRQWAKWMRGVGLQPSDTGAPGGKEIGDRMTHYVIEGGPFESILAELLDSGLRLSWVEDDGFAASLLKRPSDRSNRWKYTCPDCGFNAWAKPDASLICGGCIAAMTWSGTRVSLSTSGDQL